MLAEIVVTYKGSLHLIGKSLAKILKKKNRRVLFSQGITNQFILRELGLEDSKNVKGYITRSGMTSCKDNQGTYIYEQGSLEYISNSMFRDLEINNSDIFLKGGNSLVCRNGVYEAGLLSASPDLGTFKNIYLKAIAASAEIYLPISLDKLVPATENFFMHKDVELVMGDFTSITLPLFQGKVFTEIEALSELYNLKSKLIAKGSSDTLSITKVFLVEGNKKSIEDAIVFF